MTRAAALSLFALCACHTPPDPLPERAGPYGAAFFAWSRQAAIYEGLEARVFVAATYHTGPFRAALGQEVARLFGEGQGGGDGSSDGGARLAWARAESAPSETRDFLVALSAADRGLDVLDGPTPAWRLSLQDAAGTHAPLSVVRVEPDVSARALYPYLNPFTVAYRVRFPAGQGALKLVLAGVHGRAELDF